MIKTTKTIYDPPEKSDGKRILVMRMWPRGIKKEKIDLWIKELGTDKELIHKWKTGKISWTELSKEYKKSLKGKEELLQQLASEAKNKTVTLLCSCKEEKHCHRHILKQILESF